MHRNKSVLMQRIKGFVIIVNTFLPFIMVLLIIWTGCWGFKRINLMLIKTRISAENIIESAMAAKKTVLLSAEKSIKAADNVKEKSAAIVESVNYIAHTVENDIKAIDKAIQYGEGLFTALIIDKKLKKKFKNEFQKNVGPIAAPFKTMAKQFEVIGKDLNNIKTNFAVIVTEVKNLKGLQVYLDTVIAEYREIRSDTVAALAILSKVEKWGLAGTIIFLIWIGFSYFLWCCGRVATGVALIRGKISQE